MIDLKFIRQNPDMIANAIKLKNLDLNLEHLLQLDIEVLNLKKQLQQLEEQKNLIAKQGSTQDPSKREQLLRSGKEIGQQISELKPQLKQLEQQLAQLLLLVPNIPAADAPIGEDEQANVVIKNVGQVPQFNFTPKDHVSLLQQHNWADLTRITQVSGSRSYALTNDMVLLELGLLRFALEKLQTKGFTLISVPSLAREFAFTGTGHFPTGKDQAYFIPTDELYLTGTSEVVLNALHHTDNLNEQDLPILYAGFSPCFRREAGSAGKDTRGLIRVHQFYKIEQFVICKNSIEESDYWQQQLLHTAEEILQDLEIPYQVVAVSTGDMGSGKYRQYDLEAWVPSEQTYRETHSCSSLLDWQARRTNLRYRDQHGKMQYCFTLNNTAIATPRILVPLLENHQQADGNIKIPAKLQAYIKALK